MNTPIPPTPTLELINSQTAERNAISGFLDWLDDQSPRLVLCKVTDDEDMPWVPALKSADALINGYFGTDPADIERERRALLDWHNHQTNAGETP